MTRQILAALRATLIRVVVREERWITTYHRAMLAYEAKDLMLALAAHRASGNSGRND